MKVWLGLVLILAGAAVVAACAGHEWASPVDLARGLAGDGSLRSRLLVEWRLPRVFAAALVGVLRGLGGAVFQAFSAIRWRSLICSGRPAERHWARPSRCSSHSDYRNRCSFPRWRLPERGAYPSWSSAALWLPAPSTPPACCSRASPSRRCSERCVHSSCLRCRTRP